MIEVQTARLVGMIGPGGRVRRRNEYQPFTVSEDARLRADYATVSCRVLAADMGRTEAAVRQRAYRLGLRKIAEPGAPPVVLSRKKVERAAPPAASRSASERLLRQILQAEIDRECRRPLTAQSETMSQRERTEITVRVRMGKRAQSLFPGAPKWRGGG